MSSVVNPRRARQRALPPVHAAIEAQAAAMWARFHANQTMARPEDFPAVCALYYAALDIWKRSSPPHGQFFTYEGRRYRWEWTNAGRLRVLHPKTGALLIVGGPFALYW